MAGAVETETPVILMVTEGGIKYAGLDYVAAIGKVAAASTELPVVLHLDHCTHFDTIVQAIKAGFTSVMIDGSALPFNENIKLTQEVVRVARAVGVAVEAELGRVGGKEGHIEVSAAEAMMTDPEAAVEFVAKTQVDCLAVAIGTSHGLYRGTPKLNFTLLKELQTRIRVPLVLHGGSGLDNDTIRKAIRLGIRKLNIWTELAVAQAGTMRRVLNAEPELYDPRKILAPGRESITAIVKNKILLAKSS